MTPLRRLASAYALAWATTSMSAGPGSAALVALTGNIAHAGLYIAVFYLAAAFGGWSGGRLMDSRGRVATLGGAYWLSAAGFAAAGIGVATQTLVLFIVGVFALAAAFGAINLTRLVAAELFAPAERGRGIAYVQLAAIAGAIVGPVLLVLADPLSRVLGRSPLELVWFLGPPLVIVAAFIVSPVQVTQSVAPAAGGAPAASARVPLRGNSVLAGTVALAASQAAMASVMGVAGAATAHAGHGVRTLGGVMISHFVGMFAFSRVAGRVADRRGGRATIMIGLLLLAAGGGIVALTAGIVSFALGLFVVGVGWSFGTIGSTLLIADAAPPEKRARVMGRAELVSQLSAAVIAIMGGWWYARAGDSGLGVVAVIVALLPLVVLGRRRPLTSAA